MEQPSLMVCLCVCFHIATQYYSLLDHSLSLTIKNERDNTRCLQHTIAKQIQRLLHFSNQNYFAGVPFPVTVARTISTTIFQGFLYAATPKCCVHAFLKVNASY